MTQLSFDLDSQGFLRKLAQVEHRFNQVVETSRMSFIGIDDAFAKPVVRPHGVAEHDHAQAQTQTSPLTFTASTLCDNAQDTTTPPCAASSNIHGDIHIGAYCSQDIDPELTQLSIALFGPTCWSSLICIASLGFDNALVESARQFLTRAACVVHQQGLAVWLYDLINDATMAMFLRQSSTRMPVTIRPMSHIQISRWLHGTGIRRIGTKTQREEDRREYANQAHRLAAYCMIQWGSPAHHVHDIASTLLTNPGIGMCILREDPLVRAQGATTDRRYRRVIDYLHTLRSAADLGYARAMKHHEVPELDPDMHTEFTMPMDQRYLYDAHQLLRAYRALWESQTPTATQLCMMVEETRTIPDMPLWENPVYLRELAESLMGPTAAADLTIGFETRDYHQFDRGVRRLEQLCTQVETLNVLMLPVLMMDELEPDWRAVTRDSFKKRTSAWRAWCDICDDAAVIVLNRFYLDGISMSNEQYRTQCALALMRQDIVAFCDVTLPLVEQEIARLHGDDTVSYEIIDDEYDDEFSNDYDFAGYSPITSADLTDITDTMHPAASERERNDDLSFADVFSEGRLFGDVVTLTEDVIDVSSLPEVTDCTDFTDIAGTNMPDITESADITDAPEHKSGGGSHVDIAA